MVNIRFKKRPLKMKILISLGGEKWECLPDVNLKKNM